MTDSRIIKKLARDTCKDVIHTNYIESVHHHPITKLEKRLYKLRERHTADSSPSPTKTNGVIYAIYGTNKHLNSPIYVGQTTRTAYKRWQEEINTAKNLSSHTPISDYIRQIGRYNVGVYVLQKIENINMLEHYERVWIHRLETHVQKRTKPAMNVNWEHQPLLYKKRTKINKEKSNKDKTTEDNDNRRDRDKNTSKHLKTVIHLANYKNIENNTPMGLKKINLANLYKIVSICTGKIIKHKPYTPSTEEIIKCETTYNTLRNCIASQKIELVLNYVVDEISDTLEKLKISGKAKEKKSFPTMQIFTSTNLGRINNKFNITKILNNNLPLLETKIEYLKQPKIIYKNLPNNGSFIMNHKKAAKELKNNNTIKNMICQCKGIKNETYKKEEHVNTGNMNIVKCLLKNKQMVQETINTLNKGVKFIPRPVLTKQYIKTLYGRSIDEYSEKIGKLNKSTEKIAMWKKSVKAEVFAEIDKIEIKNVENKKEARIIKNNIKFLQNNFVITCIDKMPNNFCIICKKHWMKTLYDTTINTTQKTYEIIHNSEKNIIKNHKAYLNKHSFKVAPALPIKYITSKQHKAGWRPITAAPNTTTTALSKALVLALDLIIKAIKSQAIKIKMITGYNTFFDIENAADLKQKIEEMNNNIKNTPKTIETADITGWYDNVNHEDLIQTIKNTITQTFLNKRRKFIKIKNKYAEWTNKKEKNSYHIHYLDSNLLSELIEWRIKNQYVKVGSTIVRQIIGTGQGDNHSGHLCRLLSITYEKNFMEYYIKNEPKTAELFTNTLRKHDDYIFFNNPNILPYLKNNNNKPGLMPSYFELKSTTIDPQQSNYLDTNVHIIDNPFKNHPNFTYTIQEKSLKELKITASSYKLKNTGNKKTIINRIMQFKAPYNNFHNKNKIWNTKTYNKKDDFETSFKINSFPLYQTFLPLHCKLGAVTGRLHSFATTNAYKLSDFLNNVKKLFFHLTIKNGFNKNKLNFLFKKYIHNTTEPLYFTDKNSILRKFHYLTKTKEVKAVLPMPGFPDKRSQNRETHHP